MKYKKHIITILFCISIFLSIFSINPGDFKYFLPTEAYEKLVWGTRFSIVAYEILVFLFLANEIFKDRTEYLKKNNYIPLLLFIIVFIFLTLITLPKL